MENESRSPQISGFLVATIWLILLGSALGFSIKYGLELSRLVSNSASVRAHTGPIRIGIFNWPGYYPLVIAKERGLFKKYGVEVELVEAKTIGELNDWVRTGRTQATVGVLADFVILRSLGTPVQMMIATDYSLADVIIGRFPMAKPADLLGKRIGLAELNSFAEYFVIRSLELAGVNPRAVQLRTTPVGRVPDAIFEGEIDAGHTWDPTLTDGIQRGLRPILSSSKNPQLVIDGIAFREEITQNLETPTAIGRAFFEALAMQKTEPGAFVEIPAKYFQISTMQAQKFIDEDVKFTDLSENIILYDNAGVLRDEARAITRFFDKRGMGSDSDDLSKLIDSSVIRRFEVERTMEDHRGVVIKKQTPDVPRRGEK